MLVLGTRHWMNAGGYKKAQKTMISGAVTPCEKEGKVCDNKCPGVEEEGPPVDATTTQPVPKKPKTEPKINPWNLHVAQFRKSNPEYSFKECLQKAKLTYKKV